VKLLRPGNLHASGRIQWTERNTAHLDESWRRKNLDLLLKPGDIVINLTAQSLADEFLGRVCMLGLRDDSLLNQRLARLTPVLIDQRYCLFLFKSRLFRSFIEAGLNTGSLIQHMFTSQIDQFLFPLPSVAEQSMIAERCDLMWSVAAAIEKTLDEGKPRSEALRQSVLNSAFAAELVPQDPADEPASVLLERIAAERYAADGPTPTRSRRRERAGEQLEFLT
jgi:type I restriction enzyme, S subunit